MQERSGFHHFSYSFYRILACKGEQVERDSLVPGTKVACRTVSKTASNGMSKTRVKEGGQIKKKIHCLIVFSSEIHVSKVTAALNYLSPFSLFNNKNILCFPMRVLCVAEKPSAGKKIAEILSQSHYTTVKKKRNHFILKGYLKLNFFFFLY